jgi:hypothetical protein
MQSESIPQEAEMSEKAVKPGRLSFFGVSFSITYKRSCKNAREIVYACAARNSAMYLVGDKKRDTMYWRGNCLRVGLLFPRQSDACAFQSDFQGELNQFAHSVILSQFSYSADIEVDLLPERILNAHYDPEDYDYGEMPFACDVDPIANTLAVRRPTAEVKHMMIERHELPFLYKAYLKGVAEFPEERDNPNNQLVMNFDMRQAYDALVTLADYSVPLFAIRFVLSTGLKVPKEQESQEERERVIVAVESPDERWLTFFFDHWAKAGSRLDAANYCVFTFLDVPDAAEFERCLTYKYQHTLHVWRLQRPGMRLSPREAEELRRAAHAAVWQPADQGATALAAGNENQN